MRRLRHSNPPTLDVDRGAGLIGCGRRARGEDATEHRLHRHADGEGGEAPSRGPACGHRFTDQVSPESKHTGSHRPAEASSAVRRTGIRRPGSSPARGRRRPRRRRSPGRPRTRSRSLISMAPMTLPGTCASLVIAPTRSPGRRPARRPPPTNRRTHEPSGRRGVGRADRDAGHAMAVRRPARAGPGAERRRGELDLVTLTTRGAFDQADGGSARCRPSRTPRSAVRRLPGTCRSRRRGAPRAGSRAGSRSGARAGRRRSAAGAISSFVCVAASMFAEHPVFAWLDQGDRGALAARTSGPPDPMDICVRVRRDVEVDDVRHVLDVKAAAPRRPWRRGRRGSRRGSGS